MFKRILFHAGLGIIFFIAGVLAHDFAREILTVILIDPTETDRLQLRGLGEFVFFAGGIYACGSTIYIFSDYILKNIIRKKARQELLGLKKLLNEGVLTQNEFDVKAHELKKIIL